MGSKPLVSCPQCYSYQLTAVKGLTAVFLTAPSVITMRAERPPAPTFGSQVADLFLPVSK